MYQAVHFKWNQPNDRERKPTSWIIWMNTFCHSETDNTSKLCVRGKYYSLLLLQLLIFDLSKYALLELGRGGTNIQYLVYLNVNQHSNKFLPIWILFIILYIEYIHSLAYKLIFTVETWQIDKLPSRISHLSVSFLQWNSSPPASVLLDCKQE